MLLRVKITWLEDELPLRLPFTRPVYVGELVNDIKPNWSMVTSFVLRIFPAAFASPQLSDPTSPEKPQVKFTEEPTNPEMAFP